MISAKLLHIGDIHYPDNLKINLLDLKDKCFPKGIPTAISQNPFRRVLKKIAYFSEKEITAILFSGDLTSFGDIDEYGKCALQLIRALSLDVKGKDFSNIFVVPGNHDINRGLVDEKNINKKFECLNDTWVALNTPVFSKKEYKVYAGKGKKDPILAIFSMNSCVTCGEKRYIHELFIDEIEALFQKLGKKEKDSIFYELLDAPAFFSDEIDTYYDQISNMPSTCLPVILAHHNLLPQQKPRISLYSDVINAGMIRGRLQSSKRPVIYCHGHIHSQEVEIAINKKNAGDKLILISAPEITEGFNLIQIDYNDNKIPIGCIVDLYRIDATGAVNTNESLRIPFLSPDSLSFEGSKNAIKIIKYLKKSEYLFDEIFLKLRDKIKITRKSLSEYLIEIEWFGIINIENKDYGCRHWRIRRKVP